MSDDNKPDTFDIREVAALMVLAWQADPNKHDTFQAWLQHQAERQTLAATDEPYADLHRRVALLANAMRRELRPD